MLQDFRRRTVPETGAARLALLREAMRQEGIDAFLVPRSDAHQGENVAERDERLAWLTGFTGSAGFAVIALERAAIFVDGRYTIQVRDEVDTDLYDIRSIPGDRAEDYLREVLPSGGRVAFDPWLHTGDAISRLEKALEGRQIGLHRSENLIDRVWEDQPEPPANPVLVHPVEYAGRSSAEKRAEIAAGLMEKGRAAQILTLPDSIAWLLNIRGSDIARTPVVHGFAVLKADATVEFFINPREIDATVQEHLGPDVSIRDVADFEAALEGLTGPVGVDPATAPVMVADRLNAAGIETVAAADPCILPKARKSEAEIAGTREAHLRDGAAMVRFLAWFDKRAPEGGLTEIDAVKRLEEERAATGVLKEISFETISGAGPNGAIVHYRVSEASNREIVPGELFLLDSGAQYQDGTTDITRTLTTGSVPKDAKMPYTLVLRGLIAMSDLRWPEGLAGREIDTVARADLWRHGMDYDHGTGHGVGAYLGVHEGPASLSRRSGAKLEPGMILSIEPGYYREGAFGIRIENLGVVSGPNRRAGEDRAMLEFETLTFAPIDTRLVDVNLLGREARDWLNAYHAEVREKLTPLLDADAAAWLQAACRPV